jgi:hypothetical protein
MQLRLMILQMRKLQCFVEELQRLVKPVASLQISACLVGYAAMLAR